MSQIGVPQDNILEPMAGGYPATTPAAAGTSAMTLGQNLVDDANQQTGGRDSSDTTKLPKPYRVAVQQPDLPKANTQHKNVADPVTTFQAGTSGGAFDADESARARSTDANGLLEVSVVTAQPLTIGYGAGYGAMSGGTPNPSGSGAYGGVGSSQGSFAAINRTGSRNHANLSVIHRPGDNQAAFLF